MPAAIRSRQHRWSSVCISSRHHLGDASMAQAHRVSSASTEELPADLLRLISAVQALPDHYARDVIPALERVVESTKRRRRILTLVQDALSQLRLDMKYLMFDVEATRRRSEEHTSELQSRQY